MRNMSWYEHLAAGWPLVLGILFGGAVGGGCGGLAYGVSIQVFNSELPTTTKHLLCLSIGIGAAVGYFVLVYLLTLLFPQWFR